MKDIYDLRVCELGEGPLWHPLRKQLFWFDILNGLLRTQVNKEPHEWAFNEMVSAAGWIDYDHLLVASEKSLLKFHIDTGASEELCALESSNYLTRSNDGRADPWGGFWIGTMGKKLELEQGSIYRYYQGELRQLFTKITIPNAMCFLPSKTHAYFADTQVSKLWKQKLDPNSGWPVGEAELFLDFTQDHLRPDGAVCDAQGNIWIAFWGSSKVMGYDASGQFIAAYEFPAAQVSCPAFGGDLFDTLFVTTAAEGLCDVQIANGPDGQVFSKTVHLKGLPEPAVII
jgi:sugar lactone lactonase YvrE